MVFIVYGFLIMRVEIILEVKGILVVCISLICWFCVFFIIEYRFFLVLFIEFLGRYRKRVLFIYLF